jgi:Putative MetA-pathway of phenol degradation
MSFLDLFAWIVLIVLAASMIAVFCIAGPCRASSPGAATINQQLTPDRGQAPFLGDNKSRVAGIGPQIGFILPAGSVQAYLNLKAYWEFDADNRPSGFNTWATLSFSPSAGPPPAASHPVIAK